MSGQQLHTITAIAPTWFKKEPIQSDKLPDFEKRFYKAGETTQVTSWEEMDAHRDSAGHVHLTLGHGAGDWYAWAPHWNFPWDEEPTEEDIIYPIDWHNPNARISDFFKVGEVTRMSSERIPTDPSVQKNILRVAAQLDEVRKAWGSGFKPTSWYRPLHINRRVGGASRSNHIQGHAVDIYPTNGDVYGLQRWFETDWFNTGRWKGGFGRGAKKGFIHIDLGNHRVWNY